MSDNIIQLATRRHIHPTWGAIVSLEGVPIWGGAMAEVVSFWGEDEHADPAGRLRAWAVALDRLANEMLESALLIDDAPMATKLDQDGGSGDLMEALRGFADDYMTSETHHPGYVLIPTSKFERICSALGLTDASEKADG